MEYRYAQQKLELPTPRVNEMDEARRRTLFFLLKCDSTLLPPRGISFIRRSSCGLPGGGDFFFRIGSACVLQRRKRPKRCQREGIQSGWRIGDGARGPSIAAKGCCNSADPAMWLALQAPSSTVSIGWEGSYHCTGLRATQICLFGISQRD